MSRRDDRISLVDMLIHAKEAVALFGSVLRDDFTPESDVDVIVDFEPGQTPGLEFITMQDELSEILGRQVDMWRNRKQPQLATGDTQFGRGAV